MSEERKLLLVGLSSRFMNRGLFSQKIANYLSNIKNYDVIAINDVNKLAVDYFGGSIIDSISAVMPLPEKRKLVKNAEWAVFFWDGTGISDFVYLAGLYCLKTKVIPVVTTRVVNKERGDDFDVYIGRGTPWGNPFSIGDRGADRAAVLEMFKEYFQKRFIDDEAGNRGIRSLRGKVLGCHCKPAACHGDIIAAYLNSLDD